MKKIQLNDLGRQYHFIREEILEAVTNTLDSGWYVLGKEVTEFEKEFARYCGTLHCSSVANGTDALELALKACGVAEGGEVITTANAGMYSTTAISSAGATPVFADIQATGFNICPKAIEQCITPSTQAIVVTHLFGQLADIEKIMVIANNNNIPVVEDCAQAHGAQRNGKKAGSWGTCAAFSFYPTKNLGALGDGGAVISNQVDVDNKVRKLRQYGWSHKYHVDISGGRNSRLDEIQAAILRVKLKHLDQSNKARLKIASLYSDNITHPKILLPSFDVEVGDFVSHLFVIKSPFRNQLQEHLTSRGIGTDIHYPILDYQQAVFQGKHAHLHLHNAESNCKDILTLPSYPELSTDEVLHICEAINSWV